ncbi:MAG TPA: DUF2314 domain-containing protein [Streptosporangiaceae bacterium]
MTDSLTLPVPEVLAAVYLVPASMPAEQATTQARAAITRHVAEPLRDIVRDMLDRPILTMRLRPASALPPVPARLQEYLGADPAHIQTVSEAAALITVRAVSFPGSPPMHELAARAAAAALAAEMDLPIVDTRVPQILSAGAALAALPGQDRRLPISHWVQVFLAAQAAGLCITTKGLGRFGLPELQLHNVPPQLGRPCTMALTGLASRLLSLWWGALRGDSRPAFVELPTMVEISGADVARAYQAAPGGSGQATVRLAFDPATEEHSDSFLTVLPPAGYTASAGEHLSGMCDALFGTDPPELRWVAPATEAMDRAMSTARQTMPDARARFVAGQLPPGAQMMVKHRVTRTRPQDQGEEFVWAYVTSWREAGTVLGNSADDAVRDPQIRAGRPVVIDAATIVDWALWIDGPGIVEGGWTNEVALHEDGPPEAQAGPPEAPGGPGGPQSG